MISHTSAWWHSLYRHVMRKRQPDRPFGKGFHQCNVSKLVKHASGAPPMRSGILRPVRSISLATKTISSSDGVIRPEQPRMSALLSMHA
eukprot:3299528-Pleurochrysis_carterae.AAC.4